MSRDDEIVRMAREAAGDEVRFMRGLLAIARRDLEAVLDELRALDQPGSRAVSYAELARLGRRLAAAAALLAEDD